MQCNTLQYQLILNYRPQQIAINLTISAIEESNPYTEVYSIHLLTHFLCILSV